MGTAATIVLAREDLSIPGAAVSETPAFKERGTLQGAFFDLVSRSNPDVIVLDLSRASADGAATIMTVRQQTDVPILVVCASAPPLAEEYRDAGAADCIAAPLDIGRLNQAIQKIFRIRARPGRYSSPSSVEFHFDGIAFHSWRNVLTTEGGPEIELTGSEGRLLGHFATRPWTLCTSSELAELLYGCEDRLRERAIDFNISCLRKKLGSAGIADAQRLIRTEPRRGYLFAADVWRLPHEMPA